VQRALQQPVPTSGPELLGARVLAVEDEAAVRKVNVRLLRRLDCEVTVAAGAGARGRRPPL